MHVRQYILMLLPVVLFGYGSAIPGEVMSGGGRYLGKYFKYEASKLGYRVKAEYEIKGLRGNKIAVSANSVFTNGILTRRNTFQSWNKGTDLAPIINNQCDYKRNFLGKKEKLRRCYALKFLGGGSYLSWRHNTPSLTLATLNKKMQVGAAGMMLVSARTDHRSFNNSTTILHDLSSVILSAPRLGLSLSRTHRTRIVYVVSRKKVGKYRVRYESTQSDGSYLVSLKQLPDDHGKKMNKILPKHVSIHSNRRNPGRSYVKEIHFSEFGMTTVGRLTDARWR